MKDPVRIIDAYHNKCIPDRYLNLTPSVIAMFENQVCVCLSATYEGFGAKYEIEDEIRAAFMEKIFGWIRECPTEGSWSVVSHGTHPSQGNPMSFISTLGFVFAEAPDAERFLQQFVLLEKLTTV